MVLDYSSTSFGDIPIKHSSELDGSPCILVYFVIHNIYSYAFLICYRFLLTMAVSAEIKDILIHIADTQST